MMDSRVSPQTNESRARKARNARLYFWFCTLLSLLILLAVTMWWRR
jgi:hypothetical protein